MKCDWQIFMRLKTRLVIDPYRVKVMPPVQLVVMTMLFIAEFLESGAKRGRESEG